MNRLKIITLYIVALFVVLSACHTRNKTQKGAAIGAGTGGIVGAFIGKSAGNTALGAVIGGAVGGAAGAFIGRNMDRQAAQIKETVPGATVIRSGEGIIVKFNSGILFDAGKTAIKPDAQNNLQNLATSLQKNSATNLLIIGHTDDKEGSTNNGIDLSLRRAQSVRSYLVNNGIDSTRMSTVGKGETEPIADNKTPDGRAQNRRVEIVIIASDVMKKQALEAKTGN